MANPFKQPRTATEGSVDLAGEIQSVQVLSVVQGVAIQRGAEVVESNALLADSRIDAIAAVAHELRVGYGNVGREANYWLFGFQSGQLMVVSRGECIIWALLKRGTDQIEMVHAKLKTVLRNCYSTIVDAPSIGLSSASLQATAEPEGKFPEFLELVRSLLCRVIGGAQADRIIQRDLSDRGYDANTPAPEEEFANLGKAILENVPNRSRRKTLFSEFESALPKL